MSAAKDARVRIETGKADAERRMRSAVDDVLDGHIPIQAAHRNRKVGRDALRAELEKRGWVDPHRSSRRKAP